MDAGESAEVEQGVKLRFKNYFSVVNSPTQPFLQAFIVTKMRSHQALPQLAVIEHKKVQQLMNDDIIPNLAIKLQQFCVEIQVAGGRARGPFIFHRSHRERTRTSSLPAHPSSRFLKSSLLRI